MKLYKYLAGLGLAGCMIFPSCMPVLADGNTKTVHVEYQVDCSYIWNIHADIDFGKNAGVKTTVDRDSNTVSVTKNVIQKELP